MNTELRKEIARIAVNVADDTLDCDDAMRHVQDAVRHAATGNEYPRLLEEAQHHLDRALHNVSRAASLPDDPYDDITHHEQTVFYLQPVLEELGYILD